MLVFLGLGACDGDGATQAVTDAADAAVAIDLGQAQDTGAADAGMPPDVGPADAPDAGDAGDVTDIAPADAPPDTTGQDLSPPADVDAGPPLDIPPSDTGDPSDPCSTVHQGLTRTVIIPLGETLFFDGDDLLAFWGKDHLCAVAVAGRPAGSVAPILDADEEGLGGRLTPDLPGTWTLHRGPDVITMEVDAEYLNPDTFLNFNYTPTTPLAVVGGPDPEDASDLWVASPASNAVQRVRIGPSGAADGDVQELIPTGAWPTAVVAWEDAGLLLVAQAGRDSLGFLDLESGRIVDAIRVGNEPASIVLDRNAPGGPAAYVALSGEDRVAKVSLEQRAVVATVDVGRDPRAMVLQEATGRLFVAALMSSNAHPRGPKQPEPIPTEDQHDVAVIDTATFVRTAWIHEVGTILRGLLIRPDQPDRLVVALTHANNTALGIAADSQPHLHRLAIVDIGADSETRYEVLSEVDLDGQPSSSGPAASPFSMGLTPDGSRLLVTLSAGQGLLVLDPTDYSELERVPAGSDPRGLVVAHGRVWTYAWLDNAVQSWLLPNEVGAELAATSASVGNDPTSLEVKQGQRMFNDASFSKHGDFSCNSCHVDGLHDGMVWDLLTDGPVNTLAFRNVGGTAPFLWGGQLPTLFDFSREVLKLVGATASGEQMQLLTIYMQSVVAPPNPYTLPGGKLTEQAERGRLVFEGTVPGGGGCINCHSGPLLTNRTLVPGKTEGTMTDVPSLFGAYDTGPWGREGQWDTLEGMVDRALEYTGGMVSEKERADLVRYVRELPADRLYLTSARPLNDSAHIWTGSPIELAFSAPLAPNQLDALSIHEVEDGGSEVPLAGSWTQSGRFLRFSPEVGLARNTTYITRVTGGLESTLGQVLPGSVEVTFETGGEPLTDVSGEWKLTLCESSFGCASTDVALLQSQGGQVTGVALDEFDEGSVDHLEGVVDGMVLSLDPFFIDSVIGPIFVENGITLTTEDTDGDDFADTGFGIVQLNLFDQDFTVEVTATRLALPDDQ